MTSADNQRPSLPEPTGPRAARVFVGLRIVAEVALVFAEYADELQSASVRKVAPSDMHLTLVPPWNEPAPSSAGERLTDVGSHASPFTLRFRRACYGPNHRHPRLLWIECDPDPELMVLHAAALQAFGQSESKPFRPHVTIARIPHGGASLARRHPIDRELHMRQRIDSIELFQSPRGPEKGYRVISSAGLVGAPVSGGSLI